MTKKISKHVPLPGSDSIELKQRLRGAFLEGYRAGLRAYGRDVEDLEREVEVYRRAVATLPNLPTSGTVHAPSPSFFSFSRW